LFGIRRVLLTRSELLTDEQKIKLESALNADDAHAAVEVTAWCYQDLIAAYCNPDRRAGKFAMFKCLKRIRTGLSTGLEELAPARPQPVATTSRNSGLLRCRGVQRARRSDQRAPRTPTWHRPRLPQPRPLHRAVTDPLRPSSRNGSTHSESGRAMNLLFDLWILRGVREEGAIVFIARKISAFAG
jgi:hypothetical protein